MKKTGQQEHDRTRNKCWYNFYCPPFSIDSDITMKSNNTRLTKQIEEHECNNKKKKKTRNTSGSRNKNQCILIRRFYSTLRSL